MDQSATHQRALVAAAMKTTGPILELGMGWYSTPILHEIAAAQGRMLISADHNHEWILPFRSMASPTHVIHPVGWWGDFNPKEERFGLIFVDHAPACRREDEIRRFLSRGDVFVLHDTEEKFAYGYNRTIDMFKYRCLDSIHEAQTMIVSNVVDVTKWIPVPRS